MTPEILTMLGMTATILVASWTMNRSLRVDLTTEIKGLRTELKTEIQDLRTELKTEIQDLREAQHGLNERMAGVEGLVTGLKEAIFARAVA